MIIRSLAKRCYDDPNFRASLDRLDLSETMIKRVLFCFAEMSEHLWPYNSVKAHRYALRKIAQMGDGFELAVYESLVSDYINNPKNW